MGLSFEQPEWLWGLLAVVPLCLVALTGFGSMSRWRRATAALARAALTVLIVAMLAGAQSVRETERLAVIGVVDVSGSVRRFGDFPPGDDIESFARRYFTDRLENRGADDLLGLVVFDGRTATVATPSRATVLDRSLSMLPIEGTDLAGALRHAAALVPPDASGRLVLVSDGNATGADPVEVAALLGTGARAEDAGGDRPAIPVDVLPVGVRVDDEVIVERLDAPPRAGAGATVPLRVQLRATGPSTGTLRLLREGEPVAVDADGSMGRRVTLERGRAVEVLEVPLAAGQLSRFEVIYEPDADPRTGMLVGDRTLENNRAEAFTISPGESRVLLVDGVGQGSSEGAGAILARTLRRGGLKVEMVAPAGMPRDLLGLQAFDLVMLQNVPADALADGVMDHLVSYVRELGGGVVVVGGPETLGAGGWRGSAIEPILPVQLNLPEKLVVPEAAIVLVLDNSGSMRRGVLGSSRSQQEVANESAARAIESLDPGDMVGVIAFNNSPGVVVDLGPAANKQRIADATRGIMSGGGTNLPPALEIARDQLLAVEAKNKHIIVLSDGQSQGAERLAGLSRSIRDAGIRISSIAVGDGADLATLEQIATLGEGAFYHVVNPSVLPNVFLKAVRVVRSPLVREQPFDPLIVDSASPLVGGLGPVPRLGGLVLTQARSEPTITYSMATPEGEPVLAHWAVGLGQVAVFTSDAHDWARRWLDWEGYRSLWTRTARLMSRATGGETGELLVRREGDRLSIVYDATVFGPGGAAERVRLRQTGPGRYSASVPATRGGNYLVSARPRLGATQLPPLLSGATVARNAEYARLGTDRRTLERIAEASGGRVLDADTPVDLFDRSRIEPRRTRTPLWPVLLAWTLAVFLLDVGTRRIAWDRLIGERGDEMELARIASTAGERLSALRGAAKGKRASQEGGKTRALSDADAERLRREARARRHQQQEEELRRLRAQGATAPGGGSEAKTGGADAKAGEDPKPTDSEPESGLLAAKRRARQRFEERGDG